LENGKTAFVDFLADDQVGWGSTEYIILRPKPPLPAEIAYYLARSEELRNHTIQNMTGTSGRQRAPASCLDRFLMVMPSESIAKSFGEIVRPMMQTIRSHDQQSRALAVLRDTLLPKLISGEIRVGDLEKMIANAA
jgi:type I restriction enzyme S subunit